MIMIASLAIFLAVVLSLMYLDHRRETKAKHAH